jgi:RimJ/RimL family protein N-acetyltransferase
VVELPLPPPDRRGDAVVDLRPWQPDDAADLTAAWSDGSVAAGLGAPPLTDEGAAVERIERWQALDDDGKSLRLAVVAADGSLVGGVSLTEVRPDEATCEVAYWLAPSARGEGHATGAVRRLTEHAFQLGFERLEVLTQADIDASRQVAVRAGFVP